MKRWLLYYLLSSLLVLGFNFLALYAVSVNSEGLFALIALFYFQFAVVVLIGLVQLISLIINICSKQVRLKFMIALSCVYTLVFLGIYAYYLKFEYNMKQMYVDLDETESIVTNVEAANKNIFIGTHAFFLIPLILQIIIFIVLFLKKKKQHHLTHD